MHAFDVSVRVCLSIYWCASDQSVTSAWQLVQPHIWVSHATNVAFAVLRARWCPTMRIVYRIKHSSSTVRPIFGIPQNRPPDKSDYLGREKSAFSIGHVWIKNDRHMLHNQPGASQAFSFPATVRRHVTVAFFKTIPQVSCNIVIYQFFLFVMQEINVFE